MFLGRFGHHFKKSSLVHVGFFLAGAVLLMLGNPFNIWVAFLLVFFLGIGNAFIAAPLQTILHEKIPRIVRGRVFGVQNMLINSAFTFPVVIFGRVADIYGLKIIIISLGALVLAAGLFDRYVLRFRKA